MPIPARFQLQPPSKKLFDEMCELCVGIEEAVIHGRESLDDLLEQWHKHATCHCGPTEFTSYHGAMDKEDFVQEALNPRPTFVEDLTYAEAVAVLECVEDAELSQAESTYFVNWLETQFPGSSIGDLIYWPDCWFDDSSYFREPNGGFKADVNLTPDQVLAYAMARSSRKLPDSPSDIPMPFPMPNRPGVIEL